MKLDIARDGNAVEVRFKTDIWAYPAGHGPTLAAALRQLADELEEFHCNVTPGQLRQSDEQILDYMKKNAAAEYERRIKERERRESGS